MLKKEKNHPKKFLHFFKTESIIPGIKLSLFKNMFEMTLEKWEQEENNYE